MMMQPIQMMRSTGSRESGFAMMTVLFVLLTLLMLTAPFLTTARNADRASAQLADRAQARVTLDAASRHARVHLQQSHPALDSTPDWDDAAECDVTNRFAEGFLDANKTDGVMWDLDVDDLASRIDLNSASPQVLANMMGLVSRLSKPLENEAVELDVRTTATLPDEGYIWIGGEFIAYRKRERGRLLEATRGLFTEKDEDDNWITDGPRPPTAHPVGGHVIDQRAFATVDWRIAVPDGVPRMLDAPEQLEEAELFSLAGGIGPEGVDSLRQLGTVFGAVRAGKTWQRAARLTAPVEGGEQNVISVDDPRWFTVGSTVKITDGEVTELRYVQRPPRGDRIILNRVLDYDYSAYEAEVSVLQKRPVNLNTAPLSVLEVLFTNLQLTGQNARISEGEASTLAALTAASRPFEGMEDWMRRIILPAAAIEELPNDADVRPDMLEGEVGVIEPRDALALYINGMNANDSRLAYATMPFCFTARDVYAMELRATVNAPSGTLRTAMVRDRVELISPQSELFYMWWRQADFDEALRLTREAPLWASGPAATTRYDGSTRPPSRVWPNFGTLEGRPYVPGIANAVVGDDGETLPAEHVFAVREDEDSWIQLWPSRLMDVDPWTGRSMHFDHETRDLEGRYLPDRTIQKTTDDKLVAWTDPGEGGLMQAMSFSMWVKPQSAGPGVLLDVGNTSRETDRLLLAMEEEDLVLRLLDAGGDHNVSQQVEASEVRFAIAAGDGPGLPVGTWSHLEIDVSGSRPDQMHMRVNGLTHGVRRPGMTRLTQSLSQGQELILVESTDGFPAAGVCRIGNELIEYVIDGDNTLRASHNEEGELAGFGGRLARTQYSGEGEDAVPVNIGQITVDHPAGTTVTHYGYSSPISTNLPTGGVELPEELDTFRVARLMGVDTNTGQPTPVVVGFFYFGLGISGANPADWILALGDDPQNDPDGERVMSSFNENGGYAAIVQRTWFGGQETLNEDGSLLGGIEVIRYSGYTDNILHVAQRAVQPNELARLADLGENDERVMLGAAGRTFVFDWEGTTINGAPGQTLMEFAPYVVPISIPAPDATDLNFLEPDEDRSEFAQITHTDAAELTEWVRYDDIQVAQGQLVRSSPDALRAVYAALVIEGRTFADPTGGDPPGSDNNVPPEPVPPTTTIPPLPPVATSTPAPKRAVGVQWDPLLGEDELIDYPMSRAASDAFQFRGVFGTKGHLHPAGTQILPVFRVGNGGVDSGRMGAQDTIFVFGAEIDHPGWPLTVQRGHVPALSYVLNTWSQPDENLNVAAVGQTGNGLHTGFVLGSVYVALQEPCPEAIAAGGLGGGVQTTVTDSRILSRLSKFPSGERPRVVTGAGIGTSFDGSTEIGVPSAVVDEIVFGTPEFARGMTAADPPSSTQGGQIILANDLSDNGDSFEVFKNGTRIAHAVWSSAEEILNRLPEDAGLLRVGEEILCYDFRNPETGEMRIAVEGRGLLGTTPQPHEPTEPMCFLEHAPVSVLTADIGPGDAFLPLVDLTGFPPEGTVLVGGELIHYTRQRSGALEMPKSSSQAGKKREDGNGIFRGRYGTASGSHAAGTPVIYFHIRYWDRWSDRADCPELSYFGFEFNQPSAWWNNVFWDWEPSASGSAVVGVLQRSDPSVPWDEEPDVTEGLDLMWQGYVEGEPIGIGRQSDRIEWRVFVRYDPNAFEPQAGMSHAWKETPRFRRLGLSFFAPGRVLRSVDR